ncbi:MAG: adenylate/guanylate cyclase domain-containing protein [Treponema sp.]|jgi:adenylate cyclase|nr:adenylate/guanylate cyclase domain-containing protein [Treponema sp.]
MKKEKKQRETSKNLMTVRFSIGAKLITIISIIVLLSLGSITALVSWLVRADLERAAEENNFEANRRSAIEAEATIANAISNSRIFFQTITALGTESHLAQESVTSFFNENPLVACVFFSTGVQAGEPLMNRRFFDSRGIDSNLAKSYMDDRKLLLRRAAAGETLLFNATPHIPASLLAIYFPWKNGGASVLFSSSALNEIFGFGMNQSWFVNKDGDILVHADFQKLRAGAKITGQDLMTEINKNRERKNWQSLVNVEAEFVRTQGTQEWDLARQQWETLKNKIMPLVIVGVDAVYKYLPLERAAKVNAEAEGNVRLFAAFTVLNTGGATVITSIEYDKVFEGINDTTRRNIYLTVTVLSISIILIWFFSKGISIPLKTLAAAARSIESGSFELELKTGRRDEIGVLNSSFQRMSKALGIFGRFTNRDIAVRAMRGEIRPGGLSKHATIFFSDIRNFTSISEGFTKEFGVEASNRIVFWLNEYLTKMVECVEKTGGVVDKFIGDAVMAHWGTAYTAGSPEKDAYNCIKAALWMRKALHELNKHRMPGDKGNPSINIGCGINTGIVTAGQIGSDLRMEYTVIGDPVNLASRVEALTKPLGADILITEDTWRLVKDKIIVEEMPPVTVKGKERPVRIFAVINLSSTAKGPRTLSEVRKRLGIKDKDVSKVNVNEDEKKYKIGGEN